MGLGFGYDVPSYRIFVGSLRKAGFAGDVVLATSTLRGMRRGVAERGLSESFEKKEETKCSLFFLLSLSLSRGASEPSTNRENRDPDASCFVACIEKRKRLVLVFPFETRVISLDDARLFSPHAHTPRHSYLRSQRVLAYPFEYSCGQSGMSRRRRKLLVTPGGCVLDDWYADGDRRGPRPLAIARYEMYETWLRQYAPETYALVLDTRDTFFQADPFLLVQARRAADLKHATRPA